MKVSILAAVARCSSWLQLCIWSQWLIGDYGCVSGAVMLPTMAMDSGHW